MKFNAHSPTLAQTLRKYLGGNPLVLLDGKHGETKRQFLSDHDLDAAARELAKQIAPACPECGKRMIFVTIKIQRI